VTVAQLKQWNGLTSNNIKVGQKLVIYTKGNAPASSGSSASSGNSASAAKGSSSYTVKSGDSFYSIAKNYPGVSAQNIMDHNNMKASDLKAGMTIKIPTF
jgi:membrane-bound lytic murein transglycosylase D